MPIYEYCCEDCRQIFEEWQKDYKDREKVCPVCGGTSQRLISNTSFVLKGGGWYASGYSKESGGNGKKGHPIHSGPGHNLFGVLTRGSSGCLFISGRGISHGPEHLPTRTTMIDRYTRKEMGEIWTLEHKFRVWLEVELAICEGWHAMGVIPTADMKPIREKADFELDRILELEETTKHDVIAFLTAVEEKVGPSARYIHLGCTSSDIVDTANAVLLTRAGKIILGDLDRLLGTLETMAKTHQGRLCMGRTHGIHAEPTSFGLKMAVFHAEFQRHRQRWVDALENIRFGKISGAVGTYAQLEPELEERALTILGLEVDPISTQVIQRDRYAQYFTTLALIAGGIERICVELRHLQRTEVLEVEEGFGKGQKGSSAMPHKKNPISAENLTGLSRLVRTNAVAAMENMALWHERDISHSSVERVIMPDSTIMVNYMLNRLNGLLANLRIIPENMERNLMGSYGLFFSQRVLIALVEAGLPRQEAYVMVQAVAMDCWRDRTSFEAAVRDNADITAHLDAARLDQAFDLNYYLRHEQTVFNRVFLQGKKND